MVLQIPDAFFLALGADALVEIDSLADALLQRETARAEGFELANRHDPKRPDALDYYLKITGMTEKEFYSIMEAKRVDKAKALKMVIRKDKLGKKEILPAMEKLVRDHGELHGK